MGMDDKLDIKSYNLTELTDQIIQLGERTYRANQLYHWLHIAKVTDFDEMTNIPTTFRGILKKHYEITVLQPVDVLISKADGTRKYLWKIKGGSMIESVVMRYHYGNAVCISTQSGCRMGCRFCASTLSGLDRNLTASEMLEQIYQIEQDLGEKISHIVLMGIGEPLDNFSNVIRFIELISDEHGENISRRNITLSTCGLVPKIKQLADMNPKITLALSLHAADDVTRRSLMPIAKKYPIHEVLDACKYYFKKTGRRITFEYSLIAGVNDFLEMADTLSHLLKGMNCHVNLIAVNPIQERNYRQTGEKALRAFQLRLEKNHINVTIRREMGRDINGACGQLRNETIKSKGVGV